MTNLPFPFLDPADFPGVPVPFVAVLQDNFQALAQAQVDTGGLTLGVRAGTDTVTFTNTVAASAIKVVAHGLGRTPTAVVVSPSDAGSAWTPEWSAVDATSFSVTGYGNSTITGAETFSWVVFG